jgi:outer membrane receptor protein involved in Fe transport
VVTGNVSSIFDLDLPRTQYRAALDWYVGDLAGDHSFTFGAEYHDLEYDFQLIYPDTFTINRPYSQPDSWLQRDDTAHLDTGSILTLFAQDDWTWREDWTFNLGLRWEQQEQKNDVGERVYTFRNLLSPRLGVVWDVRGDGRSKLFAHYGRYHQAVGLQLATYLNRQIAATRYWERDPETGEWENIETTWPPENTTQADDDLEANYKDEIILGYEFEFATDFAAGVRAIRNRQNNMIEDILANEDELRHGESWESIYLITNVESARRDYRGLELSLEKRLSNNYRFLTVFTLSESKGSVDYRGSSVGVDPYADFAEMKYNRYGNLPWDDEQYLKVNGSYHLPLGLIVGASLNWRSGWPYNRIASDLPEGTGNIPRYANLYYLDPRGSHRVGSAWWLDLRLRKDFEAGPTTISLTADAFNLTNNQTVTRRHGRIADGWGEDSAWIRAGYFVLGGKLTF